ncbi:MAG: hypothetical protein R3D33_12760 [Hyphomicrobiaceae bacterium]
MNVFGRNPFDPASIAETFSPFSPFKAFAPLGEAGMMPAVGAMATRAIRSNVEVSGYLSRRARASLELPRQAAQCRSPQELGQLHTEYMTAAWQDTAESMQRFWSLWLSVPGVQPSASQAGVRKTATAGASAEGLVVPFKTAERPERKPEAKPHAKAEAGKDDAVKADTAKADTVRAGAGKAEAGRSKEAPKAAAHAKVAETRSPAGRGAAERQDASTRTDDAEDVYEWWRTDMKAIVPRRNGAAGTPHRSSR